MLIGGGREEHFVIRPSRIDVIIFSSGVLLATDSYHLNSVGIPVDFMKLLKKVCFWLEGVARESTIFQNCITEKSTGKRT